MVRVRSTWIRATRRGGPCGYESGGQSMVLDYIGQEVEKLCGEGMSKSFAEGFRCLWRGGPCCQEYLDQICTQRYFQMGLFVYSISRADFLLLPCSLSLSLYVPSHALYIHVSLYVSEIVCLVLSCLFSFTLCTITELLPC